MAKLVVHFVEFPEREGADCRGDFHWTIGLEEVFQWNLMLPAVTIVSPST